MIHRLKEVTKGLYRGSAPSPTDVLWLKKHFKINKIVSLDKEAGEKISRTCEMLGIKQVKCYIDGTKGSLFKALQHNIKDLLLSDGPTYVHCLHGKDRTGLIVALFQCKYMGYSSEKALKEAKSLGFGVGVDPEWIKMYEKAIQTCKPDKDSNNADIVSNVREYQGDGKDSFLDAGHQGSFAPYLSVTKQYPDDPVYNSINDQSPTRENYDQDKSIKEHEVEKDVVPVVGLYNNDAGGRGFGPTENNGGFFYD